MRARDLRNGTIHDLGPADRVTGLHTSFDGGDIAVAFPDRTLLANLATGARRTLPGICRISGLSATTVWGAPGCERRGEDSRLVTVRPDGTGAFVGRLTGGLLSPDRRLLAGDHADGVLISDATSGAKVALVKREHAEVLAWFGDHEVIVEASPYELVDIRTGRSRRDPALPDGWISYIAWPGSGDDRLG